MTPTIYELVHYPHLGYELIRWDGNSMSYWSHDAGGYWATYASTARWQTIDDALAFATIKKCFPLFLKTSQDFFTAKYHEIKPQINRLP